MIVNEERNLSPLKATEEWNSQKVNLRKFIKTAGLLFD